MRWCGVLMCWRVDDIELMCWCVNVLMCWCANSSVWCWWYSKYPSNCKSCWKWVKISHSNWFVFKWLQFSDFSSRYYSSCDCQWNNEGWNNEGWNNEGWNKEGNFQRFNRCKWHWFYVKRTHSLPDCKDLYRFFFREMHHFQTKKLIKIFFSYFSSKSPQTPRRIKLRIWLLTPVTCERNFLLKILYISTLRQTDINTSTRQHINTSTHRHIYTMSSTHQHIINISPHQDIRTPTH